MLLFMIARFLSLTASLDMGRQILIIMYMYMYIYIRFVKEMCMTSKLDIC